MYGIIYKITNTINDKIYVGQTISIRKPRARWSDHKRSARNNVDGKLYNAMRKYGIENFTFEIIDTADSITELDNKEIKYIKELNCQKNGYNVANGGNGKGCVSEETKKKISLKHKGKVLSQETRLKLSKSTKLRFSDKTNHPFYGRRLSNEHLKKLHKTTRKMRKPVVQLSIEGKPLYLYESLTFASLKTLALPESINKVCNGKQKTARGFKWDWYDDRYKNAIIPSILIVQRPDGQYKEIIVDNNDVLHVVDIKPFDNNIAIYST